MDTINTGLLLLIVCGVWRRPVTYALTRFSVSASRAALAVLHPLLYTFQKEVAYGRYYEVRRDWRQKIATFLGGNSWYIRKSV